MDHRIHQLPNHHALHLPAVRKPSINQGDKPDFKDLLEKQHLKISKHALQRLDERNIQINDRQWQTIHEKMLEAKNKGITDSLVVMNHAALLVSAKNHTVVTAMDRKEATSKIFTNINGTILIDE